MLTAIEFREYCKRLGFPSSTVELIQEIRTSCRSRQVSGSCDNVPGFYLTDNSALGVRCEFHTVEFSFVHKLGVDPYVLESYCQPSPIPLVYNSASGRRMVVRHIPDYFVLWHDRAGWVETRSEEKLRVLAVEIPNRYQLVADRWVCSPGTEHAAPLSLRYEVHSLRTSVPR